MVRNRATTDAFSHRKMEFNAATADAVIAEFTPINERLLHVDHMHCACDFEALIASKIVIVRNPTLTVNDSKISAGSEQ
jgi:hypothetical protein